MRRIDPTRYKRLLSQTMPVIIESEAENERTLKVIEKLMDKGENLSPEEEKLLKLLTRLVEDFEERYYQPKKCYPFRSTAAPDGIPRHKANSFVGSIRFERNCF